MKSVGLIPAFVLAVCALSTTAAAMQTVPYPGTTGVPEPNRLTGSNPGKANNWGVRVNPVDPVNPYLSLVPSDLPPPLAEERRGPGFLNVDPFDPNSVVNSYERSLYANPFPYDPIYNPYGQGASPYAPRGGANVPMGNGMRYGR